METILAVAVRAAVNQWKLTTTLDERVAQLATPLVSAAMLGAFVEQRLLTAGVMPGTVRQQVLTTPFVLLEAVFDPTELADTPIAFNPVPDTVATVDARAAALAVHAVLKLETVSYGTENEGNLFVNLVVMPGKGQFARKSKRSLRGHTDAVSFPLNGEDSAEDARIAPSPDVVTLIGLRNPHQVPTTVMALTEVLERMDPDDIAELKKRQFSMNSQLTFEEGMRELWEDPLVAHEEAVLTDVDGRTHVRYSHKNVVPTDLAAQRPREASNNFESACNAVAEGVVIKPGDILLVSNRIGLHGRGDPGDEVGGVSRWLLRTYALDTTELPMQKRHMGDLPAHVLYP